MILVPLSQAYAVSLDLPARPDAAPTFTVYSPEGATLQTGTSTLDGVSTTLSGAASAAAQTLSLASATGVTAGRRYLLAGTEEEGGEVVTVRSISGTTATLVRPLTRAAASGATFKSTRISVSVSAVGTVGRHHRIALAYDVGAVAQPPWQVPFDVVRYVVRTGLTLEDVRALDPQFAKRLPAGTWLPGLIERAWAMLLARVAAKVDPGAVIGGIDLTTAHGYLVRALALETAGPENESTRALMAARFEQEFEASLTTTAVDNDQDGIVERNEGVYRSIPVSRG